MPSLESALQYVREYLSISDVLPRHFNQSMSLDLDLGTLLMCVAARTQWASNLYGCTDAKTSDCPSDEVEI